MARYLRMVPICLIGSLAPSIAGAQERRVVVGGEIEARLEVVDRPGGEGARSAGLLFLRPTISVGGGPEMSLDVRLSTPDEATGPAHPEEYSFGLDWGGAQAGFGHVKQSYSRLSVQDVSVQGGRFSVQRRGVRLSAFGGRSAPENTPQSPVVRQIQGGRIGVGDPESTSFDIVAIRSRDEVAPLASSGGATALEGAGGVPLQQSLVLGAVGSIKLFDEALSLRGEIMRSGLSSDAGGVRETGNVPEEAPLARDAQVDHARSLEATARISALTATARYRTVGADYQSPGVQWLPTDRREVGLSTTMGVADWSVGLNASRERDNLSGREAFTTAVTRLEAGLALPRVRHWSAKVQAKHLLRSTDASDPDDRTEESTWSLGVDQDLGISQQGVVESVQVGYEYEVTDDANSLRSDAESASHTVNVQVRTSPADGLRIVPSFHLVRSVHGPGPGAMHRVYAMEGQHQTLRGRLRVGLQVRRTERPDAAWWEAAATSRLALGDLVR